MKRRNLFALFRPLTEPGSGHFPNVLLRTHKGQTVRFYDDLIRDKIVLINFMYTNCEGKCPRQTANLVGVQKILGARVGRDIFMYSITLDPARDTPDVLRRYVGGYPIRPGWDFVTGSQEDIEKLRRRLGLVDLNPVIDADRSQHIGTIVFGNESLDRWGACPALQRPELIAQSVLRMEGPKTKWSRLLGIKNLSP
jgi:protein SCO1/2